MEKVAVYGAGVIGAGLATLLTGHGINCIVIGRSEKSMERCRKNIEQNWNDLIENNLATEKNKLAAMKLFTIVDAPTALDGCTFVFEAVTEDLEQKREAYEKIEKYADLSAIIASCTSSLNSDDLAALCSKPQNLIIVHPLNPAHMIPLVEVVSHTKNSSETLSRTKSLLKKLHREPVTLNRTVPGFLVNRFHQALYRESIYLIEQGISTAEDIDLAMKYLSKRYASIGLLEFFDDVGITLECSIALNVYPTLCAATNIQDYIKRCIEEGHTGKVAGVGLHDWNKIDPDDYRYRKQVPFFDTVKQWDMPE
ncbi:3-hydroxybutyryl-CoA dehydrogenase [anaerobic digester metagenome]